MGSSTNYPLLSRLASKLSYFFNATDMSFLENLKILLAKATCDGNYIFTLEPNLIKFAI